MAGVQQLAQALSNLALKPKKQRKRRPRKRQPQPPTPGTSGTVTSQAAGGRRRRRRQGRGCSTTMEGEIILRRRELLLTAKSKAELVGAALIDPNSFSYLKGLAKSFNRFVFRRFNVYWKPAVGTMTDGMVAFGVLWDPVKTVTATRDLVTSLTPVKDMPVWQGNELAPLVCSPPMLAQVKSYAIGQAASGDMAAPGQLLYAVSASATTEKFWGELWVEYEVVLAGTTA